MHISLEGPILAEDRIVAVGLLTQREVELLGHGFSRLWPLDDSPCFTELVNAIDQADRALKRARDEEQQVKPRMPGRGRL